MQPYFMPYIGYFQLMNAVDEFIVYDNIKFTKKGWINRNRILVHGSDAFVTLPLKKDSDFLDVRERCLSEEWKEESKKIMKRIEEAYRQAPQFKLVYPLAEKIMLEEENNLFKFIFNSITTLKNYLLIQTPLVISSGIPINHQLKAEEKVLALCKAKKANAYLNPIGGVELYSRENFKGEGIELQFIKTNDFKYVQFENDFIPFLSILDVLMFNSPEKINEYLTKEFTLM